MFCDRCGAPLPAQANYCPKCGTLVNASLGHLPNDASSSTTPWARLARQAFWILAAGVASLIVFSASLMAIGYLYVLASERGATAILFVLESMARLSGLIWLGLWFLFAGVFLEKKTGERIGISIISLYITMIVVTHVIISFPLG